MRRGCLGSPARISGSHSGIHRKTCDGYMIRVTIHAIGIKSDNHMRTMEPYTLDQFVSNLHGRGFGELFIPVTENVDLRNAEVVGGLTEFNLAAGR